MRKVWLWAMGESTHKQSMNVSRPARLHPHLWHNRVKMPKPGHFDTPPLSFPKHQDHETKHLALQPNLK